MFLNDFKLLQIWKKQFFLYPAYLDLFAKIVRRYFFSATVINVLKFKSYFIFIFQSQIFGMRNKKWCRHFFKSCFFSSQKNRNGLLRTIFFRKNVNFHFSQRTQTHKKTFFNRQLKLLLIIIHFFQLVVTKVFLRLNSVRAISFSSSSSDTKSQEAPSKKVS